MKNSYVVAGHCFSVEAEESVFSEMAQYEPFLIKEEGSNLVFSLKVPAAAFAPTNYTIRYQQEDEGQEIVYGLLPDGRPVFEFKLLGKTAGQLICSTDYQDNTLISSIHHRKFAVDNSLMILYALATAQYSTTLFHAAVVSYQEKAYMFLGVSGTGKSTHASLWLKNIEGTALVNDDNPVVRISDGKARVYGSPWSGKTPCYRNVDYPIGGIVLLSQAPYNKIKPLTGVEAYIALISSISGMRWDVQIAEGLHQTENMLASTVPMWHLECLPDKAAAVLCNETIKN